MSKALVWDETGKRFYETGVDHCVLYPLSDEGEYKPGVAWNGITNISESPSGADENALYADNIKYASLRSAEEFGATVEAYMYPDEFAACDGSAELTKGVYVGQQARKTFGLCYRTKIGNDTSSENDDGYKLHLVYGCSAAPSEKSYDTVNDSPDAITLSWELTTTPVNVAGMKSTSCITINSLKADKTKLAALEKILYGSEQEDPRMPLPDEIKTLTTAEM